MNFNDIFASPDTMLEHRTWAEPNRLTRALDLQWVDYNEEFLNIVKGYLKLIEEEGFDYFYSFSQRLH